MEKDLDAQSMSSAKDGKKGSKKEKYTAESYKKKIKILKEAFQKERKASEEQTEKLESVNRRYSEL